MVIVNNKKVLCSLSDYYPPRFLDTCVMNITLHYKYLQFKTLLLERSFDRSKHVLTCFELNQSSQEVSHPSTQCRSLTATWMDVPSRLQTWTMQWQQWFSVITFRLPIQFQRSQRHHPFHPLKFRLAYTKISMILSRDFGTHTKEMWQSWIEVHLLFCCSPELRANVELQDPDVST